MRIEALQDTVSTNIDYPVVAIIATIRVTSWQASRIFQEIYCSYVEIGPNNRRWEYICYGHSVCWSDQANVDQNIVTLRTFIDEGYPTFYVRSPGGICNIKTQLEPRWFTNPIPWRYQWYCHSSLWSSGSGQVYVFLRVPIVFQRGDTWMRARATASSANRTASSSKWRRK
jgi:hypothetical protein